MKNKTDKLNEVKDLMPEKFTRAEFIRTVNGYYPNISNSLISSYLINNCVNIRFGLYLKDAKENNLEINEKLVLDLLPSLSNSFQLNDLLSLIRNEHKIILTPYQKKLIVSYLRKHTTQMSSLIYRKEPLKKVDTQKLSPSYELPTEQACIDFLKSQGYKIMKPVTQFEEV